MNNMNSMNMNNINNTDIIPSPWSMSHMNHGIPILKTNLTENQLLYWNSYNTTTYLTLNSNYSSYLHSHILLLILSAFFIYPFVLILNNLKSKFYLPLLSLHSLLITISCLFFSIFINNVPDLYPGMAYTKMINGLLIFTCLQYFFSLFHLIDSYSNSKNNSNSNNSDRYLSIDNSNFNSITNINSILQNPSSNSSDTDFSDNNLGLNISYKDNIQLNDIASPSATLFDHDFIDIPKISNSSKKINQNYPIIVEKLSLITPLTILANKLSSFFNIFHNLSTWLLLIYYFVLLPTGIACLNLLGKEKRVFNLLAHFIKGGVFFALGILSLARYCGCFAGIGGAWNYACFDISNNNTNNNELSTNDEISTTPSGINGIGSGGDNVKSSFFIKLNRLISSNRIIYSFEAIESFLIFFYGSTNVFLEHLASPGGAWTPKDLQHVSIAFMYIGAGLCGLITEIKLSNWKKSLFYSNNENLINNSSNLMISTGFTPNPFPVFTIFWTGLLMSKHAQASQLSTDVHVQWGSLLTYGSFFRILTFLLMTFHPIKNNLFKPTKPLTELITSFCLLCGGMVFMESTDQVIEALAYRGLTPMFTINVSVGIISLIMAWIMIIFSVKDYLKSKIY